MPGDSPLRWLYLDLNAYFASVEQQERPALRGRPVAVGPPDQPAGTIIAASYEAKAYGVRTGDKVREARAKCPDLIVTPGRHDLYVRYHDAIVAEVWRHIPVHAVCSIDEVACRLLENENAPACAAALGARIKAAIRRNIGDQLTASVGVAPNRLVAKMACDLVKPDGLTVIEARDLPRRLAPLPVTDIPGVGRRTAERLARRGIATIGDYCALSAPRAGAALGSVHGDRLWWRLHGADVPDAPPKSKSVGHSHVLAPQRRDAETARLVARRLLLKAASRLRRGGWVTTRFVLAARLEGGGGWRREARLAATADSWPLLALLDAGWPALDRHLGDTGARIRTIGVTLADVTPDDVRQASLFALLADADPLARAQRTPRLSRAMDAINARFGRNAVTLGPLSGGRADRVGARIAFGRIPDAAEFHE
jgi:DNA polymerase-4